MGRRPTTARSPRTQPDQMWGMDATSCLTRREGTATVFVVVDHCAAECIGLHAAKPGTRFEAVEPLRQGVHAALRGLRGRDRPRAAGAARSRQPVRQRLLPRRAEVPGDRVQSRVRAGAGGQRGRRAVHPDAQGATALGADVRHRRGAASGPARVQGALQPGVALRTTRASDAGAGTRAPPWSGRREGRRSRPDGKTEGRRGSRIDREEGGAIAVFPPDRRPGRLPSTRCPRNPGRYRHRILEDLVYVHCGAFPDLR